MPSHNPVVVTGAGGFIGGHLVAEFRKHGNRQVRAVDIKPFDEWYQRFDDVENLQLDLNLKENCEIAAEGASEIYNLAANMGGMGFIEHNKALCMLSVLINTHMLQAAVKHRLSQVFLFFLCLCIQRRQTKNLRGALIEGRRRLPCAAGGWLWLGETVLGTDVPPFPGRFRSLYAGSTLSQCIRSLGYVVWGT